MENKIQKRYFYSIVLFILYIISSWTYRYIVIGNINYTDTKTFRSEYSGLMLTDTIEYYNFNNIYKDNIFNAIIISSVKNYLGPILLIRLIEFIPFGDLLINNAIILLSIIILNKILKEIKYKKIYPIIILLCNPYVIYYSQGINKEIPLILCLIIYVYSILKNNKILSIISILMTFVFRVQIGLVFIVYFIFRRVINNIYEKRKYFLIVTSLTMMILPIVYSRMAKIFLENSSIVYGNSNGFGIGEIMNKGMLNIPLFGYIGIPVHVIQNIFEPIFTINISSITGFMSIAYSIIILPFLIRIEVEFIKNIINKKVKCNEYYSIDIFILITFSILFISIDPLIHNRYMFFLFSMLPLARKKVNILQKYKKREYMNNKYDIIFDFSASYIGGGLRRLEAYMVHFKKTKFKILFIINQKNIEIAKKYGINYVIYKRNIISRILPYSRMLSKYSGKVKVFYSYGIPVAKKIGKVNYLHLSNALIFSTKKYNTLFFDKIKNIIIKNMFKIYKQQDIISAESKFTIDLYKKEIGWNGEFFVSKNGYNEINNEDEEYIETKEKYMITIGTEPYKRLELVYEIYKQLKEKNQTKFLIIVGNIRKIPKNLVNMSDIFIAGYITRNKVINLLKRAEVYITASEIENSSNALIEGLIYSKNVIVSTIPSHLEIIDYKLCKKMVINNEKFLIANKNTIKKCAYINWESSIKYLVENMRCKYLSRNN